MVLNLIINGLPSKPIVVVFPTPFTPTVLNLIINGLPSKPPSIVIKGASIPFSSVLNLIINGLPSKH